MMIYGWNIYSKHGIPPLFAFISLYSLSSSRNRRAFPWRLLCVRYTIAFSNNQKSLFSKRPDDDDDKRGTFPFLCSNMYMGYLLTLWFDSGHKSFLKRILSFFLHNMRFTFFSSPSIHRYLLYSCCWWKK
jgi:hypothetical protein